MGFYLEQEQLNAVFTELQKDYSLFAPKVFAGSGCYSDTDCVRYGEVESVSEIVFDRKSEYSFKEALLPAAETLFFFTEHEVKEADGKKKGALIFLRSCDLHALKRLDEMYLNNGPEDFYYKRLRDKVRFVLMGCKESFDSCFCVDMGTNKSDQYSLSIEPSGSGYELDCKEAEWEELFHSHKAEAMTVTPSYVTETKTRVQIPEGLNQEVMNSKMWEQYHARCISCGRCNFVCPTCTCFTMQDLFYSENGKVGERRRVWASCMVDGYTDVAGGGSYRQKNGQRMRFKVLHKVLDYKERNGYHMCVGCGRCDDICPEYISFSHCVNMLSDAMQEVNEHEK